MSEVAGWDVVRAAMLHTPFDEKPHRSRQQARLELGREIGAYRADSPADLQLSNTAG